MKRLFLTLIVLLSVAAVRAQSNPFDVQITDFSNKTEPTVFQAEWGGNLWFKNLGNQTCAVTSEVSTYKLTGTITIPPVVKYKGKEYKVVCIQNGAFKNQKELKKINVSGNNLTFIESKAFLNCTALESIVVNKNCKFIYPDAFDGCVKLLDIGIPKESGNTSFVGCSGRVRFVNY